MEEKDFIKFWIWLTQIPYVGSVMEGRLLAKFKSPQDIYDADEKCLRKISGITKRQIASILQARSFDRAEKILEDCETLKIYVLTSPHKTRSQLSTARTAGTGCTICLILPGIIYLRRRYFKAHGWNCWCKAMHTGCKTMLH